MMLKIFASIAVVFLLVCSVGYFMLQKFGKDITTPVTSLIDEDQLSALLQRFYNPIEAEKAVNELKRERMSRFLLKGSVGSVKSDIYLHKRESEWVVNIENSSSFTFTRDGFAGVGGNGNLVSAMLLRGNTPYQMFDEKVVRHADDLLLVILDGNILSFDFSAKRFHYRPIDN